MAQKHIHKYRRVNIGRNRDYLVMQCSLPNCNHYVPMANKESIPTLIGKIAICNKCNDPFELTRESLRKAKPVCAFCVGGTSKEEKLEKASKFFADLEKKIASGE
jgi:hypothetical protein